MQTLLALRGSRRARRAFNILSVTFALAVTALAVRWFAHSGWPFAHAEPELAVAAAGLFLASFAVKAYGWSRLFAPHERPRTLALAVAGGGASVTGVALPGRFDDAVRIALVRRHPGCKTSVKAVALSLFTLGLIEAVAMMPFASTAAASSHGAGLRAGLALVAGAGLGAAGLVLAMPWLLTRPRLAGLRAARWLAAHVPSRRDASTALVFVQASWVIRAVGLFLLLHAFGISFSIPLATLYMVAAAASAALPIAPAGAATQAGAGASVLIASGVHATEAVSFAVAAQVLAVLVGAAIVLSASAWHARLRFAAFRPA